MNLNQPTHERQGDMKEIQLTRGLIALVDDEDYEWLNQWNWHASTLQTSTYYARKSANKDHKPVLMHRLIMGITDTKIRVDHIDGNGLNNQRANLRASTPSQNCMNRNCNSNNLLGIRGVHFSKYNKYVAQIMREGKKIYLGCYDLLEDAIEARKEGEKLYHGEFAKKS